MLLLGLLGLRSAHGGVGRKRFIFDAIAFSFPIEEIRFFETTTIDGRGNETFQEFIIGLIFIAKFLDMFEKLLEKEKRIDGIIQLGVCLTLNSVGRLFKKIE